MVATDKLQVSIPVTAGPLPVRSDALRRSAAGGRRRVHVDPLSLLGVVLLLVAWQAISVAVPPIILPPPINVVRRLLTNFLSAPSLGYFGLANPNLYGNLLYTVENIAIAMIVGTAVGVVIGLTSVRFGLFRAILDPVMMTVGTVPILIAAPFFLIWFGVGRVSAVSLVTFYVAVILYGGAQRAAGNLNPIFEEFARTLGASEMRIVRDLLIPATVPEILGSLRIALAGCWGLEAVSELMGSQEGVGKVIEAYAGASDSEGIMASLLMLGLVAVLVDAGAGWIIRRVSGWNAGLSVERT